MPIDVTDLEAVKVEQSRVMTALDQLLKNEAVNLDYAARVRGHVYKALENARRMGRLEATENSDAPTEVFQQGYEAGLEDVRNGTIPMWIVGLLDEVEFMGQEPDRHGITVSGPFFEIDIARAYARTMSTDPDEAVIVPVKI